VTADGLEPNEKPDEPNNRAEAPNGDEEVPAVGTKGLSAVGKTVPAGLRLKLPKPGIVPALGGTFADVSVPFLGVENAFIPPADQSKVALGFASEDGVPVDAVVVEAVAIVPGFSLLQTHFVTSSLFWRKHSGHFHPSDTGIFNPAADQSKPFFL